LLKQKNKNINCIINFLKNLLLNLKAEIAVFYWKKETLFLKKMPTSTSTKTALFCNLLGKKSGWQTESLLASALRKVGYKIFVLLPKYNPLAEKIFKSTGETEIIYYDKIVRSERKDNLKLEIDKILRNIKSFSALLNLKNKGFRIGKNVSSLALRRQRVGSLNLSNKKHFEEIKNSLRISLESIEKSKLLLNEKKPSVVIFNEKGYSPAGEIFDLCIKKRIKTIQWCGAPQSDCLLLKKYDATNFDSHPHSLDKKTWQRIQKQPFAKKKEKQVIEQIAEHYKEQTWYNRQKLQQGKKIYDKEATLKKLGISLQKKIAVIFCHILYDATFFYGHSIYSTYEEWLIETVRYAIKNQNLEWVLKVHPVNVWRSKMDNQPMEQLEITLLKRKFGKLPNHIKVMAADTEINTFSLFQSIDYGVTVRGTIGMELPCWGIPVVTAGTGRYNGLGFTLDPKTAKEYKSILLNLHNVPKPTINIIKLARKHAFGVFFMRPFPIKTFSIKYEKNKVELSRQSIANKKLGNDLEQIARWIKVSRRRDLIFQKNNSRF